MTVAVTTTDALDIGLAVFNLRDPQDDLSIWHIKVFFEIFRHVYTVSN